VNASLDMSLRIETLKREAMALKQVWALGLLYPRETSPHQDSAGTAPQRHTAAGTAAPITADTGNTVPQRANPTRTAYAMLNTRNEERNAVFYSYLACFVNTFTLNMYVSMSYTGLTRRNRCFIFLW